MKNKSINMVNEKKSYIIDQSQPKCQVGIMRESRASGCASACLIAIFIIILLFALGILSIKFTVFFVPIN